MIVLNKKELSNTIKEVGISKFNEENPYILIVDKESVSHVMKSFELLSRFNMFKSKKHEIKLSNSNEEFLNLSNVEYMSTKDIIKFNSEDELKEYLSKYISEEDTKIILNNKRLQKFKEKVC